MAEKKVFDVAHPESAPNIAELKPKKVMLTAPPQTDTVATTAPELTEKVEAAPISRRGITIAPIAEDTAPEQEPAEEVAPAEPSEAPEPVVADEPEETTEAAGDSEPDAAPEVDEPKDTEPEETTTFVSDSIGANDAGLDDSQRAAAATKERMQDPKIYDTKTYYVPIGNTRHRHSSAISGTIAGLVTALVAIGVAYYIASNL